MVPFLRGHTVCCVANPPRAGVVETFLFGQVAGSCALPMRLKLYLPKYFALDESAIR